LKYTLTHQFNNFGDHKSPCASAEGMSLLHTVSPQTSRPMHLHQPFTLQPSMSAHPCSHGSWLQISRVQTGGLYLEKDPTLDNYGPPFSSSEIFSPSLITWC